VRDRRDFLRATALTLAAARLGSAPPASGTAAAQSRASREQAALGRATEWLNSPRLAPPALAGKVVLVDFCTYTCINWLRTLPYRRAWAARYARQFVLIGVHTPEFAFEQDADNVRRAMRRLQVEYPIVIDNDYAIWRAFDNQYWPALYFLDGRGRVRDRHFGEGEYARSERIIQRLLSDSGVTDVPDGLVSVAATGVEAAADWATVKSPESYLGYARAAQFASPGGARPDRRRAYTAPRQLGQNQWALVGEWTIGKQAAVLDVADGRVACSFHARDLHLVMGPPRSGTPIRFRVTLDGQPPGPAGGLDVDAAGLGTATDQRLYQLIRQPGPIRGRSFEIEFLDAGVEAFAFTFG
jgi:hypothetical protein